MKFLVAENFSPILAGYDMVRFLWPQNKIKKDSVFCLDDLISINSVLFHFQFSNLNFKPLIQNFVAMTSLRYLHLHVNALIGTLPFELGAMTSMNQLTLNNNTLTGTIPSELAAITSLTHLYLNDNVLTGPIPDGVCNLQILELEADCVNCDDPGTKLNCCTAACIRRNVALGKPASQTSSYVIGTANKAVDGNTNGIYNAGSVTHTFEYGPGDLSDDTIYWKVDLLYSYLISQIKIYNRSDCCLFRLRGFYVEIHDANDAVVWTTKTTPMVDKGANPTNIILELCEGDCDNNDICAEGLTCEHRSNGEAISQCSGESGMPVSHDVCTVPATPQDITTFTIASPVIGYTVWVKLDVDATNRILSLAEVEVYGTAMYNAAFGMRATQVSDWQSHSFASKAVDGNLDGNHPNPNPLATLAITNYRQSGDPYLWWKVNLGRAYTIDYIQVYNRQDTHGWRLNGFIASILKDGAEVYSYQHGDADYLTSINVPSSILGDEVMIRLEGPDFADLYLQLAEVEVYTQEKPAFFIQSKAGNILRVDSSCQAGGQITFDEIDINDEYQLFYYTSDHMIVSHGCTANTLALSGTSCLEGNIITLEEPGSATKVQRWHMSISEDANYGVTSGLVDLDDGCNTFLHADGGNDHHVGNHVVSWSSRKLWMVTIVKLMVCDQILIPLISFVCTTGAI